MQQWHKANYFYFDFFLIGGNLRRFVAFLYKLLNVADVIIMHSVPMSLLCLAWKKQSNLCAVLNVSLDCLCWVQIFFHSRLPWKVYFTSQEKPAQISSRYVKSTSLFFKYLSVRSAWALKMRQFIAEIFSQTAHSMAPCEIFMCRPLFNMSEEETYRLKHESDRKAPNFSAHHRKKWRRKQIRIALQRVLRYKFHAEFCLRCMKLRYQIGFLVDFTV